MWRGRDGGENDKIRGPQKLCHVGSNGHHAVVLEAARRVFEFLGLDRRRVVQADFLDLPSRIDQEVVHVPGDEPGAHDAQRMRPARLPLQPVSGKSGRRGCPCGRDDRALEYGKRISGLVAIEHEHRRRTRKASLDVAGIAGDPLQPGHVEAVSEVGRKGDDPAIGLLGEPQEVAVRVDGLPVGVREIRVPNDADAVGPMGADDVEDGLAADDRQIEVHGPYSSFIAHVGLNTVSRYGVPRSAHTNSTVGRSAPTILAAYRLTAANAVPLEAPTNSPWVVRSSRHASTLSRSDIRTTSSILACDSNGGTMLDPTPGRWRLRGAAPKKTEPLGSGAKMRTFG